VISYCSVCLSTGLHIDDQHTDVRGGYAGDAAGLAEVLRSDLLELFLGFPAKSGDGGIVDVFREGFGFHPGKFLDLTLLAADIPFVFQVEFHLVDDGGVQLGTTGVEFGKTRIADLGTLYEIRERNTGGDRGRVLCGENLVERFRRGKMSAFQTTDLLIYFPVFFQNGLMPLFGTRPMRCPIWERRMSALS